jgi:hypothetical protein
MAEKIVSTDERHDRNRRAVSFLKDMRRRKPYTMKKENHSMKILKRTVIQAATIQMEDWENGSSENRYAVLWKAKDEENRYSARSLQDAEEYYDYRCLIAGQKRI